MFRCLVALILIVLLPFSAQGEIKTITHTVKQVFGGSQSPDDARIAAVAKAQREALEMAGTYIESTTVVKDSSVAKESASRARRFKKASRNLQALAALERALAERTPASRIYTHTKDLHAIGAVSEYQLQESNARYDIAVAFVKDAETAVKAGMAFP